MKPALHICVLFVVAVFSAHAQPSISGAAEETARKASLTREELLASVSQQLVGHLQLRGELQLELQRPWTAPAPVAGGIEAVVVEYPARLSSALLIRVRLQAAGRTLGEQTLPLNVRLYREVYVARSPLTRDALLDRELLDLRRVDVVRERDAVAAEDCGADFTLVANVPAGRLLAWRDLTRRQLVRKGQVIEVAAVDGSMTVTTKALAMESGAAGDSIRVRNLASKRDFTASVVAEARAQVRF